MFKLFKRKKKHICDWEHVGIYYNFSKSEYWNENDRVYVFELYQCIGCSNTSRIRVADYELPNTYRGYITDEHEKLFKKLELMGIRNINDYNIIKSLTVRCQCG